MKNNHNISVLQVFGSLNMGGAESRMMDVYRNIDRNRISFDFVSLQQGSQFFENEISGMGGRINKLHSPREIGIINHIKELRKVLREGNYNAVHAHTSYHCGMVMLAAWLEKVPVRISHARTTGSKSASKAKRIEIALGKLLIKLFSTAKFAISNDAGKFLFGNSKFDVIPNAIDFDKYQVCPNETINRYKKELQIPDNAVVIGQIGRFDSMKNHVFSVNWFEQFQKTYTNSFLIFVGDGKLRSEIEKLTEEKGLKGKVIFTGVRNDVPKFIHIFDAIIFPSLYEGLGGVAIEAQAAGVPVVESEFIPIETDLDLGLIKRCPLDDYNTWTKAVEQSIIINSPSKELIKKSFDKYGYSLDSTVKKYTNVYGSV